jgi:hypothetical protein
MDSIGVQRSDLAGGERDDSSRPVGIAATGGYAKLINARRTMVRVRETL